MKYEGFNYFDGDSQTIRRIYYIEEKGKDISFERWRLHLYYKPNFACTSFYYSSEDYETFLKYHKQDCFTDYVEYLAWYKAFCLPERKAGR